MMPPLRRAAFFSAVALAALGLSLYGQELTPAAETELAALRGHRRHGDGREAAIRAGREDV